MKKEETNISGHLTREDVNRLLQDPSAATRQRLAEGLARDVDSDHLSPEARAEAEDILRILARDVEVIVRASLAEILRSSPHLPYDVALKLANDVDQVAVPVLQFSEVLRDSDLIAIIRSHGEGKQTAIAHRQSVAEAVAHALVQHGTKNSVLALLENDGADLAASSLNQVIGKYGRNAAIQSRLMHRRKIPTAIAERLVSLYAEELGRGLQRQHDLAEQVACDLILQLRERAMMDVIGGAPQDDGEAAALARGLHRHGHLTPSLILRTLCMGDTVFLDAALSELSGLPLQNVNRLTHDRGMQGLPAIWKRAELPEELAPLARTAIHAVLEIQMTSAACDYRRRKRLIVERILNHISRLPDRETTDMLTHLSDLLTAEEDEKTEEVTQPKIA